MTAREACYQPRSRSAGPRPRVRFHPSSQPGGCSSRGGVSAGCPVVPAAGDDLRPPEDRACFPALGPAACAVRRRLPRRRTARVGDLGPDTPGARRRPSRETRGDFAMAAGALVDGRTGVMTARAARSGDVSASIVYAAPRAASTASTNRQRSCIWRSISRLRAAGGSSRSRAPTTRCRQVPGELGNDRRRAMTARHSACTTDRALRGCLRRRHTCPIASRTARVPIRRSA